MRWVLHTIADAANRDGDNARPGIQAIVEGSLFSVGHVRRTIAKLIDEGWLEVQERGGGEGHETVYRVLMGRPPQDAHHERQPDPPAQPASAQLSLTQKRDNKKVAPSVVNTETVKQKPSGSKAPAKRHIDDALGRHAHRLAQLAFEQPVKPELTGRGEAFPATLALIERQLRAGTPVDQVQQAIEVGVDVWTLHGLQTAIAKLPKNKPNRDPLRRGGPSLRDRRAAVIASEQRQRPQLGEAR